MALIDDALSQSLISESSLFPGAATPISLIVRIAADSKIAIWGHRAPIGHEGLLPGKTASGNDQSCHYKDERPSAVHGLSILAIRVESSRLLVLEGVGYTGLIL